MSVKEPVPPSQSNQHKKTSETHWGLNFFPMWIGQALSLIGSRAVQFALIWWLTQETGSATVLATATLVGLIPEIVISPIAGAYIDRWNRRLVMMASDTVAALSALVLAYLFWTGAIEVWYLYVILFIRGVAGAFHWPAMLASTSLMVPEQHLTRIAGLNQTVGGAMSIIGPPLGALLLATMSMAGVMLVDVVTFGLAILPLFFVHIPQPPRRAAEGEKPSIWRDIIEGIGYVRGWRGLLVLVGAVLIIKIAMTPAFALLPLLVSDYFGGDAAQLSLLEAISGVGMLIGGLLLSIWGGFRRRIFTALLGFVLLGAGLFVFGIIPADQFKLALATIFFVGLTSPLIDGPMMAILQATVAPEMQGRVFTLLGSLVALTSPLGLIIAGPVTDLIGLQVWYLAAGVVCVLTGLILAFVPSVIHIEEHFDPERMNDKGIE